MKTQAITYGCRNRSGRHEGFTGIVRFEDAARDEVLVLAGGWIPVLVVYEERWIRFGKYRKMEFISYSPHIGNICNDRFTLRPADGLDLANYLINQEFDPESGTCEIWDKIDAGYYLTPEDFGFPRKYRCSETLDLFKS